MTVNSGIYATNNSETYSLYWDVFSSKPFSAEKLNKVNMLNLNFKNILVFCMVSIIVVSVHVCPCKVFAQEDFDQLPFSRGENDSKRWDLFNLHSRSLIGLSHDQVTEIFGRGKSEYVDNNILQVSYKLSKRKAAECVICQILTLRFSRNYLCSFKVHEVGSIKMGV